ncbi:flagellar basal body rod protein FlgC [candidate division WOR-1 bacterium RIFCSPHIGHO2_01_FULL_53_15]|uniref:Flagellar basal-body rod protein FlgC n=1 Tax=candidate division WOR-1 bacterium RIFCSPHIGHO2_01_FULL_53_15 TaxID=1802564 RepID=A0A1F4Q2R4_UNCSA|nr:MAG: flagellar basal body rod protein FlgC [candidate division WOR-1 bacterium RIFCSPHIGHO2_01_FULL_53_15]OGC10370.1 MAG: flagellar basal body rod protein FlgC [candidate division WOR-1 bacterium RIFCSPHIGHO2_02_FULL_53_26]
MGFNQALEISVSGIEAQRRTMELIASNLANINTTRTAYGGGPYRRKLSVLAEKPLSFSHELTAAENRLYGGLAGGVEVVDIVDDSTPFQKVYNPGHPDADAQGYVSMPNVNLSNEMVDMIYVSKLYDANITAFNATRKMMQDTLTMQ